MHDRGAAWSGRFGFGGDPPPNPLHPLLPYRACQVLSSSGQAAEQGVEAGDVIFSIADVLVTRGTDGAQVTCCGTGVGGGARAGGERGA
jgi:hypothetical protein